jgi:hypothetical protein
VNPQIVPLNRLRQALLLPSDTSNHGHCKARLEKQAQEKIAKLKADQK